MFKKILAIFAITILSLVLLPKPAFAADPAVSLTLDPAGALSSPATVYLLAEDSGGAGDSITRIATEITFDPTQVAISADTTFKPTVTGSGIWTWTPDTGTLADATGGKKTIKIDGSTDTQIDIPTDGSVQIAKLTFTISESTETNISVDPLISIVTQKSDGANLFDADATSAEQPQSFDLSTTTAATTETTTVTTVTTAPSAISTTGPEDTIAGSFIAALALISAFFFVRRARKAWTFSK